MEPNFRSMARELIAKHNMRPPPPPKTIARMSDDEAIAERVGTDIYRRILEQQYQLEEVSQ